MGDFFGGGDSSAGVDFFFAPVLVFFFFAGVDFFFAADVLLVLRAGVGEGVFFFTAEDFGLGVGVTSAACASRNEPTIAPTATTIQTRNRITGATVTEERARSSGLRDSRGSASQCALVFATQNCI